jgi:hypothetical protein
MHRFRMFRFFLSAVFVVGFSSAAFAQATRTWVSGVGDDANPCSRTAPCKTFAGAISKTAPGGEINCLDSGGFGSVTITKALTIKCEGCIGGILAANTFGVTVNAGAADRITLSGLDIEGVNTGTNGVRYLAGASVHIHKTQIRNFRASGGGGNGILVDTASSNPELYVADSYITGNGSNATTGGMLLRPTGAANLRLAVNRTQIEDNSAGILVDGSGGTGGIKGIVRDSVVAGSTNNGITANSNGPSATIMVDNVGVANNNFGLVASGSGGGLLVGRSSVTGNATAVSFAAPGAVLSYGDNLVNNNAAGEAFTGAVIGKK